MVELRLPMTTRLERLPDGSDWAAILHGPIVMAARSGSDGVSGLRADGSRMGHVAHGSTVPLDEAAIITGSAEEIASNLEPAKVEGPLHFRLSGVVSPEPDGGVLLEPFFGVHDERYQIYWQLTSKADLAELKERTAAEEKLKAELEARTLDLVKAGEQQPEVEHGFRGEESKTGVHEGRRWRDGKWFEYTLDARGEKSVTLEVTYWGGDVGRRFDIQAESQHIATVELKGEHPGEFIRRRYPIPAEVIEKSKTGKIAVRFVALEWVAGGVFEVRLLRGD